MQIADKYLSRGRRTAFRIFDGVAIVLLMPRNNADKEEPAFELSPAGTFLWKLLAKNPTGDAVVSRFMKKYSLSRREAVRHVTGFIRTLQRQDLVEISKKPGFKGRPWLA